MSCRGDEYDMEPGDMLLLNPRDNHTCESRDGQPLDYRCLNIDADVMVRAVKEVIGCEFCFYRGGETGQKPSSSFA